MDAYKLIALGIVSALIVIMLRGFNQEMGYLAAIAASIVMLVLIADYVVSAVGLFNELVKKTGVDKSVFVVLIKVIGLAYLFEFASSIVEDFGSKSLGDKIALGGKVVILTTAMPIIFQLLDLIVGLIGK